MFRKSPWKRKKKRVENISILSLLTANPKDDALYLITETAEGKKILFRIILNFLCIFFSFSIVQELQNQFQHMDFTQFDFHPIPTGMTWPTLQRSLHKDLVLQETVRALKIVMGEIKQHS